MNILFLTNHLNIGGIASYVLSLARSLKERGHAVYIASSGGDTLTRFTEAGVIFIPIPIRTKSEANIVKLGASFMRLTPHIREKGIQVIHSNTRVTQVLGCLLGKKAKCAHVTTWHGFFKPRLFRRIFPCWADTTIAISDAVKNHLVSDFGVDEKNIRIIYNGVDAQRLRLKEIRSKSEVKKRLGLGEGPVIGIIARLSDVKGHAYLIRAMKRILQEEPSAQLLIVGEGRMERPLENLVQDLGIEKAVTFIPRSQNIPEVFYIIDVFVMPSLKEGLGLGLMEAMAWGKPVIGSNVGGIKNLIHHRENGLLVSPADPEGLANAIRELLQNPAQALVLGTNAQRFIKENFSVEQMAAQTERVYQECLKEKNLLSPAA